MAARKKKLEGMPMMGMMGMMGRGPPPRANRQTVQITEEIKEEGFDDLLGFKVNR